MNMHSPGLAILLIAGLVHPCRAQQADTTGRPVSVSHKAVLTPEIIGEGRKIFHGQGNCFACHGDNLQGGPIAPSLRGPTWRHINGSYDAIVDRIDNGMPGTAMVPHPGGISETQVLMVATYIYAVSHGIVKR